MHKITLLILLTFAVFPAHAQLWSGVLPSANATDWTGAGVVGGIPSGAWTQCGSTISAYTGTAATINSAIAACGANQYVLLGPGTFSISTLITFAGKSNVVLRGSGANSTFIVYSAAVSGNCNGFPGALLLCGTDGNFFNSAALGNWTAGYTQGSNQITVSNTTGIVTNSTLVFINQCDDGYTGHPCTGSAVDNGDYFNCGDAFATTPTGCSFNGPDSGNGTTHRFQTEISLVTNIAGSVLTLAQPLKHPNWRSGQSPEIWILTSPISNAGIENLSIDFGTTAVGAGGIRILDAYNVWVKGVRVMNAGDQSIWPEEASHVTIQDSYIYNARINGSDSSCLALTVTSDVLFQNNICQQARYQVFFEGDSTGFVAGYNYHTSTIPVGNVMTSAYRGHANGNDYNLNEGNIAPDIWYEDYHGTNLMNTAFRNFLIGWQSTPSTPQNYQTDPVKLDSYCRYNSIIANILGTPGYHSNYQDATNQQQNANFQSIYLIGSGNTATTPPVPSDSVVLKTMFRWGNWDVKTGAVRWCGNSSNTGWVATCGSVSEVPTSANCTTCTYPIPVPTKGDTGGALPNSFYLSSKPSWFGSVPWPPIGPDVSGGNVQQCSGAINTVGQFNGLPALTNTQCGGHGITAAWANQVNATPAMLCALNTMGMPLDGSGSVLAFDASICYAPSGGGGGPNGAPCAKCFVTGN
jgi:hypothetical protein